VQWLDQQGPSFVKSLANSCIGLQVPPDSGTRIKSLKGLIPCNVAESFHCFCANVAQSVEQRFRKAWVVSSILTVGSISKPLKAREFGESDWPLSVKLSVNWRRT
jgi:hypothetical protein